MACSSLPQTAPTKEERELRTACACGDTHAVFRLLTPQEWCFVSAVEKMIMKTMQCQQKIPSVNCVYHDDERNHVVSYLAGAKFRRALGSFVQGKTDNSDRERADVIRSLLENGYELDFSVENAKKQGVIHFCVESNSVNVLRLLLWVSSSKGFPDKKRPNVCLQDANGQTPMDHALKLRRFECIRLLVGAGSLVGLLQPYQTRIARATSLLVLAGPSRRPSIVESFLSSISDPLKKKEHKMEKFESELMLHEVLDEETDVKVMKDEREMKSVFFTSVQCLMTHASVDESTALTFLSQNQYDVQTALAKLRDCCEPSVTEIRPAAGVCCIVCFEEIDSASRVSIKMPCGHVTCDLCWKGILSARLSDGDVHATVCPCPECSCCFPLTYIDSLLPPEQSVRFMRLLCSRYVDVNANLKWCPRKGCPCVLGCVDTKTEEPAKSSEPTSAHCACGFSFCWTCSRENHEPATCQQAEEWGRVMDVIQTEQQSIDWVESETVPCPRCHTPIERNGGCNHMSCTVCRQQFCYQCGRKWKGHSDHYTCFSSRSSVNERVHVAVRLWSVVEGMLEKLKQTVSLASYEWHVRQYLMHELDEEHLTSVAKHMTNLLKQTLPDKDMRVAPLAESVPMPLGLECIQQWLEVLISSKRVLRNSYVLSFYLRKGSSRNKFLQKLQDELDTSVGRLMLYFTLLPGYSTITSEEGMEGRNGKFSTNDFTEQFLYCHALHVRRKHVDFISSIVARKRDAIIRAGRLGLIFHTKPYINKIPQTASPAHHVSHSLSL